MTTEEQAMTDDELAERYAEFVPKLARHFCHAVHLRDEAESVAWFSLATAIRQRERSKAGYWFYYFLQLVTKRDILVMLRVERRYAVKVERKALTRHEAVEGGCHAVDDADALDGLIARATGRRREGARLYYGLGFDLIGVGAAISLGCGSPLYVGYKTARDARAEIRESLIRDGRVGA